jgi:tetratricopeptide (TPR) repeat protein
MLIELKTLLIALLAVAAVSPARAEDDIPLAVTGLAHPSLRQTPTGAELRLADQYRKSGLEFLKKNVPGRAVEEFKDSVRLAPSAENYKALGTAYFQDGNKLKAAWAYRESIQLKPDKKLQALVDSLEGRDHPEERFQSQYDELRHGKLIESGAKAAAEGKDDSALADYLEADALHSGPSTRGPALRLGAGLCEGYLKAQAPAKAIQVLDRLQGLRERAKDLSPEELKALARIESAQSEVERLTGKRLREHQKAMLSDREAWERELAEIMARKVKDVHLNAPAGAP